MSYRFCALVEAAASVYESKSRGEVCVTLEAEVFGRESGIDV